MRSCAPAFPLDDTASRGFYAAELRGRYTILNASKAYGTMATKHPDVMPFIVFVNQPVETYEPPAKFDFVHCCFWRDQFERPTDSGKPGMESRLLSFCKPNGTVAVFVHVRGPCGSQDTRSRYECAAAVSWCALCVAVVCRGKTACSGCGRSSCPRCPLTPSSCGEKHRSALKQCMLRSWRLACVSVLMLCTRDAWWSPFRVNVPVQAANIAQETIDSQVDMRDCTGDVLSPIGVRTLASVLKVQRPKAPPSASVDPARHTRVLTCTPLFRSLILRILHGGSPLFLKKYACLPCACLT